MTLLQIFDFIIYWSLIIMPFTVVIAPGVANAFIGFFCVFFIIKKIVKKEGLRIDKEALIPFLCFFAVAILSFVNSVNYNTSFNGLIKILKGFLIFVVCSDQIRDKKHIERIVYSALGGILLAGVDGIWQFIFGFDFIHNLPLQQTIGLPRAASSFPDPNVFGVYMSMLIPLVAGPVLLYFKGMKRALIAACVLLALAGLSLTLSRGSGLAVYAAVLLLCLVGNKKIFAFILIALVVCSPLFMPAKIKAWAKSVNYNPLVLMFNEDRLAIFANSINMVKHHPFVGVGVNTFSKNYGKYKTEAAEKYVPTGDTLYAHNMYLQMAGETGLLGLAAFLWFLFSVFKKTFKSARELSDDYLKIIALSVIACLTAFLINGLTETSLYYPRVSMVFWYLIGMSLVLSNFTSGSSRKP